MADVPSRSEPRTEPRSLTARSVLLSLLLGNTPPRSPVSQLVRTASLFGIAEGTARTALSRMAAAGEVAADDGWYELTSERLLARQVRQEQSRRAGTGAWDGATWVQAVVAADGRRVAADRARLRDELGRARLAELREGVWMRPANLDLAQWQRDVDSAAGSGTVLWFMVRPADGTGASLAQRLWDLPGWAARATGLLAHMDDLLDPLDEHEHLVLAEGFVTSADVLRHLQADPLLPAALLPVDWPGTRLRHEYDRYDRSYRACLATWFGGAEQ